MSCVGEKFQKTTNPETSNSKQKHHCYFENCGKVFKFASQLSRHISTHTKECPYSCKWPGCIRKFSKNYTLTRHMKTHSELRPYACDWLDCTYSFKRSYNLKRHKLIHSARDSSYAGERSYGYECNDCGRKFPCKNSLELHILSHGYRPYSCDWPDCKKDFSWKGNLTRHVKLNHDKNTSTSKKLIEVELVENSSEPSIKLKQPECESIYLQQQQHFLEPQRAEELSTHLQQAPSDQEIEVEIEMHDVKIEPKQEPEVHPEEDQLWQDYF